MPTPRPPDFGPPGEFIVCLKVDRPKAWESGAELLHIAWGPAAREYNLPLTVRRYRPYTTTGECPHYFHLRRPDLTGVVAGWVAGVLGASNGREAWAYHTWMGPNHWVTGVIRHEMHHLLGCGHALLRTGCYETIRRYKNG